MAKDKAKKGVPNKHLHARIAYLHKAASYLTAESLANHKDVSQRGTPEDTRDANIEGEKSMIHLPGTLATDASHAIANTKPSIHHPSTVTFNPPPSGLPLQLTAHMRSVAQKAQIRLSQDLKHSFCRVCSSPLVEGETCIRSTENLSKGGRKPWADVLVVKCCACGATKRRPVGAKKQNRKSLRNAGGENVNGVSCEVADGGSMNGQVTSSNGMEVEIPAMPLG